MTKVESLKRRNYVFGGVAVLLALGIVLRSSETSVIRPEAQPSLFPDVKTEDVRSILIQHVPKAGEEPSSSRRGPEEIRIVREGDLAWVIPTSFGYPADPDKVNRFLEDLQGARRKAFLTSREETFDKYAGDDGWTHVEIQGAGGAPLATFDLGRSPSWPECYVRIEEGDEPVVVRAWNLTPDKARLSLDAWAEVRLWSGLSLADVERIEVFQREEKGTLSFVREEQVAENEDEVSKIVWKMVAPKTEVAVTPTVEGLIRSFTGMRLEDVVSAEQDEAAETHYGLAEPAYRVVAHGRAFEDGGKAPEYVLEVGGEVPSEDESQTSGARYVRRGMGSGTGSATGKWVFTVSAFSIADFRGLADGFLPTPEGEDEEPGAEEPGDDASSDEASGSPDATPGSGDLPGPLPPDEDEGGEPGPPMPPGTPDEPAPDEPTPPAPPETPDDPAPDEPAPPETPDEPGEPAGD